MCNCLVIDSLPWKLAYTFEDGFPDVAEIVMVSNGDTLHTKEDPDIVSEALGDTRTPIMPQSASVLGK